MGSGKARAWLKKDVAYEPPQQDVQEDGGALEEETEDVSVGSKRKRVDEPEALQQHHRAHSVLQPWRLSRQLNWQANTSDRALHPNRLIGVGLRHQAETRQGGLRSPGPMVRNQSIRHHHGQALPVRHHSPQ